MYLPPTQLYHPPPFPPNLDTSLDDDPMRALEKALANQGRLLDYMRSFSEVFRRMSDALGRRARDLDFVVNGGIDFPTPGEGQATEHTGNIRAVYKDVILTADELSGTTNADGCGIYIPHDYGEKPKGWLLAGMSSPVSLSWAITDMVVNGATAATAGPVDSGNYWNDVTVTSPTLIDGNTGVGSDGWTANDVVAGDEIQLWNTFISAAGDTATAGAGSATVTGSGTTFLTDAKARWYFRFTAGTDTGWNLIASVDSDTQITVAKPYQAAHAGLAFQIMSRDQEWRLIESVTPGAPERLTLASGTEVTTGAGGAGNWDAGQYVIRRPMTDTYAWFRVLSTQWEQPVVARILFF